jgi:DnaJ-class molecular chaperone
MKVAGESGYKISQVKRAYEVLSDRTMKSIYDVDGEEEVRNFEMAKTHGYVQ